MANAQPDLNVKCLAFINRGEFLRTRFGEAAFDQILARLKPETASTLRSSMAFQLAPLAALVEVDLAIVNTFFSGDVAQAHQLSRFSLERDLTTIYRFLLQFLSTTYVFSKCGYVWGKLADKGTMTVEQTGPRTATVFLAGFNPINEVFCHVSRGAMLGTLDACGEKHG
ncbi:MAG: hypothetical protein HY901_15430, partial [Deltaproteobacteria bacterium]|nr:hypothetical protein [Deltaproteobacteria bacterium]